MEWILIRSKSYLKAKIYYKAKIFVDLFDVRMDNSSAVERMKTLVGAKNDKDIADILGLSTTNFSGRKKRNSLTAELTDWAIDKGVDLNWFLRGEGAASE